MDLSDAVLKCTHVFVVTYSHLPYGTPEIVFSQEYDARTIAKKLAQNFSGKYLSSTSDDRRAVIVLDFNLKLTIIVTRTSDIKTLN